MNPMWKAFLFPLLVVLFAQDALAADEPVVVFRDGKVGLPIVIVATYIVLYILLPRFLINQRNDLKFIFWFLVTFAIAHQCYTQLSVSELMGSVISPSNKKELKVVQSPT